MLLSISASALSCALAYGVVCCPVHWLMVLCVVPCTGLWCCVSSCALAYGVVPCIVIEDGDTHTVVLRCPVEILVCLHMGADKEMSFSLGTL